MSYDISTKCIHLEDENKADRIDKSGAISFPIYQSATYAHPGLGESTGYAYTRVQNPTKEHLEKMVAKLEGGVDCAAFASGMAAISAVMEMFTPGDELIVDDDLYGGSIRLFAEISRKNGVNTVGIPLHSADVESYITEKTKAIYVETPTNPMMNVSDLAHLSEIAKKHGLLLIVDNTFLSPYLQNPIQFGADIVIHSGTKYLGGHNDTLAGFVVTANEELAEKVRFMVKTTGAGLAPFDSWLILRGMKTLGIRMERAQSNAGIIARKLQEHPKVKKVFYPGLEDHPGHDIMKKQARGFGAMITFEVDSAETVRKVLSGVRLVAFAESLGGTETLITYPLTQTHAEVPEPLRLKNGITDRILRLSVGIEDADDILEDLQQALDL